MIKKAIHYGGVLFAITAGVALLLALVNMFTSEKIADNSLKAQEEARAEVVSGTMYTSVIEMTDVEDEIVKGIWEYVSDGLPVAYAVKVEVDGYGGVITAMVGVSADGKVKNVVISEMSETAGLGTKIADAPFKDQYTGKSSGISVIKSGAAKENELVAVSGATISSRALTNGVNAAVDAAAEAYNSAVARNAQLKEDIVEVLSVENTQTGGELPEEPLEQEGEQP